MSYARSGRAIWHLEWDRMNRTWVYHVLTEAHTSRLHIKL